MDEVVKRTELIIDTPKTKNSIRDITMTSDLLRVLKPLKKVDEKIGYTRFKVSWVTS